MPDPSVIRNKSIEKSEEYVRSRIWTLEDATIQELGQLYLDTYRKLSAQLTNIWARYGTGENWSATDIRYRDRTEALMDQIVREIETLTDNATAVTFDQAARGYRGGYYGRAWVVEQGYRTDIKMPLLPAEAVRAAILHPYEGNTFVDRFKDARDEFTRNVRRSIVASQIEGDTIYKAQKRIADSLGINISRKTGADKSANRGMFARTEMIARTEILRSSNQGAMAIYEANEDILEGYVSSLTLDERTCKICVGINDNDRVYTFGERSLPPYHPNCLTGDALVSAIGISATTRRWYDGDLIVIHTSSGNNLSCTPNHPILTSQGWIAAGLLNVGGDVISSSVSQREVFSGDMNNKNVPTRIEDIAEAFGSSLEVASTPVPVTPEDFHGDGIGSSEAIICSVLGSVLGSDSFSYYSGHGKVERLPVREFRHLSEVLYGRETLPEYLHARHIIGKHLNRVHKSFSFRRGLQMHASTLRDDFGSYSFDRANGFYTIEIESPFLEVGLNLDAPDRVNGERRGFSRGISPADLISFQDEKDRSRGYSTSGKDPLSGNVFVESGIESSYSYGDYTTTTGLDRIKKDLISDCIVNIERKVFSGHVYNLQTEDGWYIANGIITHNCRCSPTPELKNKVLQDKIAGRQKTYEEWARENHIGNSDGMVMDAPASKPPKSASEQARISAPRLF